MPRYLTLLRGVNVGGHNRLPMSALRNAVSGLGATGVTSLLQSGNLVLHHPEPSASTLETSLESLIRREFQLDIRCVVLTAAELLGTISNNPFGDQDISGSKLLVLFLSERLSPAALSSHDPALLAPDQVRVRGRVIYQLCPDGVLAAPPLAPYVERHHGCAVTARNWNTVTRLARLI